MNTLTPVIIDQTKSPDADMRPILPITSETAAGMTDLSRHGRLASSKAKPSRIHIVAIYACEIGAKRLL